MILGSFLLLIVIGLLNVWVNKREKRIIQERAEERAREAAEDRARYQEYLKEQENAAPPGGR